MSKVNLDTTEKLDITCRQGDTFELTLTLKDSAGTGLTLVTDDYKFLMQVKDQATVSARRRRSIATYSGGGGEADSDDAVITDGRTSSSTYDCIIGSSELGTKGPVNFTFNDVDDSGNVTVFLSARDMRSVPPGRYVYDFQYVTGTTEKTVLEGRFTVNGDISKSL